MSYVVAGYTVTIVALVGYAAWVVGRLRRRGGRTGG